MSVPVVLDLGAMQRLPTVVRYGVMNRRMDSTFNSGKSGSSNRSSLGVAMSWSGAGSIIAYACTLVGNILIARALSPYDLGDLSYLVWLLSSIAQLLPLSVPYAAGVYVGAYLGDSNFARARMVYLRSLGITGGLVAIGAMAWLLIGRFWMPDALQSGWSLGLAVIVVITEPLGTMLRVWSAGSMDYRSIAAGNLYGSVGFLIVALVVLRTQSVTLALCAYTMRWFLMLIGWLPNVYRAVRCAEVPSNTYVSNSRHLRSFWALASEHWVTTIGSVLVWSRSELALLNWLTDSAEVALFNVGGQFSAPVQMVITLFTAPIALYTARLNTDEGLSKLANSLGSVLRLSGVISGGAALVISVLAPVIVPLLFGANYTESIRLVPLLAWAAWIFARMSIYSALAQGLGKPRYLLFSMGAGGAVLLTSSVLLIPWLGALGAALARVATQGVSLLVLWLMVSRMLSGVLNGKEFLRDIALFGLPLLAMTEATAHLDKGVAMCVGLVLIALVGAAMHWLKVLRYRDLDALKPLLQRLPRVVFATVQRILGWFVA